MSLRSFVLTMTTSFWRKRGDAVQSTRDKVYKFLEFTLNANLQESRSVGRPRLTSLSKNEGYIPYCRLCTESGVTRGVGV